MLEILTYDNIRRLAVIIISGLFAAITPTSGLVSALLLAWTFNIWSGMRADGVINIRCKNWSWRKFSHAVVELLMFLLILEIISAITYCNDDHSVGLAVCKTLNYVFSWCYFENALKNLCKAYPKTKALWIVYLFVRFEFTKVIRIDSLIDLYEQHQKKIQDYEASNSNTSAGQ